MPEVFSISGANFGAAACPVGWETTPKGNCGAPAANCPPELRVGGACRSLDALKLQTAMQALGAKVGDKSLIIAADGIVGPETQTAVNRALTTHVGPGQVAAYLRTGALSIAQVANDAALISNVLTAEVQRRGAVVPAPKIPAPSVAEGAFPKPVVTFEPAIFDTTPQSLWWLVGIGAAFTVIGVAVTLYNRREIDIEATAV